MTDSGKKRQSGGGLKEESLNREISRILLRERIRGLTLVFSLVIFICLVYMSVYVSPEAAEFLEKTAARLDNYYLKLPFYVIIWGGTAYLFLYLAAKLKTYLLILFCALELLLYLLLIICY